MSKLIENMDKEVDLQLVGDKILKEEKQIQEHNQPQTFETEEGLMIEDPKVACEDRVQEMILRETII